jgi:SAM-dependent methyltransferase
LADYHQLRDFWNLTAIRFGKKDDYAPVLAPSSKGLLNWYIDFVQRTALRDLIKQFSGNAVLEIGCGVGRWSARLANVGTQVVGIDLSREMIKKAKGRMAKKNLSVDFVVSSATNLPFISNAFNSVMSVTVLQHIVEKKLFRLAVSEIERVVRVDGNIVLLEYIGRNKVSFSPIFPTVTHFYKEEFERGKAFSLIDSQGVDLSLLLIPLNNISRKHGKYRDLLAKPVPSSGYLLSAALFYFLTSVACLFSLPFDLAFRNTFRKYCEHAIFIFNSR